MAVFFCRWVPKGEAPSYCTAPRLIQIQKYGEVGRNPSATQIGFRSCLLFCCLAFRCVLAIARYPILRRAQAREGEAEKLRLSFRYLDGPYVSILSFLCSPPYCVRFGARLRGKIQMTSEPRITRMSRIRERSARRLGFRLASAAADALQLSSDLQQRGRALPDLSE